MAYSFSDLLKILYSAADPAYLRPFFEQGDYGNGREAFEAFLIAMQRVDEAIEKTTQSLFISQFSGQTSEPATGGKRTVLELQLSRSEKFMQVPITFGAGTCLFQEVETDAGPDGGIDVVTGREYTLPFDATFLPGEGRDKLVDVFATQVGYGFANPAPGTIKKIAQPGTGYQNGGASVVQTPSVAKLIASTLPDVFIPEHVGQYVQLTAGANQGAVRRIVGYNPSSPGNGGSVNLAGTFVGRAVVTAPTGVFEAGEQVEQVDSAGPTVIAIGVVLAVSGSAPWSIVVETQSGQFQPTAGTIGTIVGQMSGANFTVEDVTDSGKLVDEVETCAWRVLDWADDLGIVVSNTGVNIPGAMPVLDALGAERKVYRSPGEDDESYRARVLQLADTISPNAIRRAGNRIWAKYGISVVLREVGSVLLPGVYFDSPPGDQPDRNKFSYDMDCETFRGSKTGEFFDGERVFQSNSGILTTARVGRLLTAAAPGGPVPPPDPLQLDLNRRWGPPFVLGTVITGETSGATFVPGGVTGGLRVADRYKVNLDYADFRAFFLVGVPKSSMGDFGIPFDAPHPYNAYDAAPYLTFADGYPVTSAVLNRATWQAIDTARAAGVGFDLVVDAVGP